MNRITEVREVRDLKRGDRAFMYGTIVDILGPPYADERLRADFVRVPMKWGSSQASPPEPATRRVALARDDEPLPIPPDEHDAAGLRAMMHEIEQLMLDAGVTDSEPVDHAQVIVRKAFELAGKVVSAKFSDAVLYHLNGIRLAAEELKNGKG